MGVNQIPNQGVHPQRGAGRFVWKQTCCFVASAESTDNPLLDSMGADFIDGDRVIVSLVSEPSLKLKQC